MSFNVLVIPEDCHKDRHSLDPIITRLVREIVPKARVRICPNPRLRGVAQALDWPRHISQIVDSHRGVTDLFLVIVDRDGNPDRRAKLDHLEACAAEALNRSDRLLIGAEAWQEVEVWILAGMSDLPKEPAWWAVRAEVNPKETYFDPYARSRGHRDSPEGGRKALALEAAKHYHRIRQLCPEVRDLEDRVRAYVGARP